MHGAGIKNYKPVRQIQLTQAHHQAIINFARSYQDFDWENQYLFFQKKNVLSLTNMSAKFSGEDQGNAATLAISWL